MSIDTVRVESVIRVESLQYNKDRMLNANFFNCSSLDQSEELFTGFLLRSETTQHTGCYRYGAWLLDTAHGHT